MLPNLKRVNHASDQDELQAHNVWIMTNSEPCVFTLEGLARSSGQTVDQVKASIEELKEKKLIAVTQRLDGLITATLLPINPSPARPKGTKADKKAAKRLRRNRKRCGQ